MDPSLRRMFDDVLDRVMAGLPENLHELMEEVPLIVEDEPGPVLVRELGLEPNEDLCGLHQGVPLTERSVEATARLPDRMMLFRGPILRLAAGGRWRSRPNPAALEEQVRITLLHEIGHHFGLDEDDLDALGYG